MGFGAKSRKGDPIFMFYFILLRANVDTPIFMGLTKSPIVSLLLMTSSFARQLDEALVQAEVVPDRVLPAGSLLPLVVGKFLLDVIVDLTQLQFALAAVFDAHGYHGYVAERWFGVNIWKKKIKFHFLDMMF